MTFAALHASAALVPNESFLRQRNNAPVAKPRGALVTVAVRPRHSPPRAPRAFAASARYRDRIRIALGVRDVARGPEARTPVASLALFPVVRADVALTRPSRIVAQGTGKGYGRHTHKRDTKMSIDYAKHVPGYDRMSRPQKYRARKHVKQVRAQLLPRNPVFRDRTRPPRNDGLFRATFVDRVSTRRIVAGV